MKKCSDLLTNSPTQSFEGMYGVQLGEFVCKY